MFLNKNKVSEFMNSENLEIIFQLLIIVLSITGGLFCIYMFCNYIFKDKNSLYIKGNTYLVLDVDEIGEKLEYYARKIESDIDSRYIYISKIILYSKTLSNSCKKESCEIYKICKILSENYNNIIFINDAVIKTESDIISLLSAK